MRRIIIVVIIIILLILLSIDLYYGNTTLDISKYEVSDSKIPKDFNNYKIIQISDFHNTKSKRLTNKLIENIEKEKPNIIVITGDLIDSRRTNIQIALNFVKQIINFAPVYYVPGNHESRISEYENFKNELINIGVNVLDNKVAILEVNDSFVELLGINDPAFGNKNKEDKDIAKEYIDSIKTNNDNFKILLSHRPELFKLYIEEDINLAFSGHAHGGQIRLPLVGGLFTPGEGLFPKYTSGLNKDDNTKMIVSRGIGNSLFPFRINNNPELIVAVLKSK